MELRICFSPVPCLGQESPRTGQKWFCCMQCKIWLRVPGFLRVLRIFYRQMHPLALLPSKGVLRTAHASICAANRAPRAASAAAPGVIALPPKPPPKPRARAPPTPPQVQPRVVQAPAPDDSIAIDPCGGDREIHGDANGVASFEALDEAEHIGVDTQDWD